MFRSKRSRHVLDRVCSASVKKLLGRSRVWSWCQANHSVSDRTKAGPIPVVDNANAPPLRMPQWSRIVVEAVWFPARKRGRRLPWNVQPLRTSQRVLVPAPTRNRDRNCWGPIAGTTGRKGGPENDDNLDHLQNYREDRIQTSPLLETKTGRAAQRPGRKPGNENTHGCPGRKVSLLMPGIMDKIDQRNCALHFRQSWI